MVAIQDAMLRVTVAVCIIALSLACKAPQDDDGAGVEEADQTMTQPQDLQQATFGGGCFWGVEYFFAQTEGVTDTAAGYMGGTLDDPTYHQVCSDRTGHAEVVQVTYDPDQVSYVELLALFVELHDPTQVDRQGPDVGSQYRSVVFYHTPAQEATARALKKQLDASGEFERPIATAIEPAGTFWRAEEYHQQYFEKKGIIPPCHR